MGKRLMNDKKIILLTDIIEQRLRKQKELEYYEEELQKLQMKMFLTRKEIDLTNTIIDIIQNETVVDLVEGANEKLLIKKDNEDD